MDLFSLQQWIIDARKYLAEIGVEALRGPQREHFSENGISGVRDLHSEARQKRKNEAEIKRDELWDRADQMWNFDYPLLPRKSVDSEQDIDELLEWTRKAISASAKGSREIQRPHMSPGGEAIWPSRPFDPDYGSFQQLDIDTIAAIQQVYPKWDSVDSAFVQELLRLDGRTADEIRAMTIPEIRAYFTLGRVRLAQMASVADVISPSSAIIQPEQTGIHSQRALLPESFLNDTEKNYLQALRENGLPMKGESLSNAAVGRHDGGTKATLALLVRLQFLALGRDGYGLPEWKISDQSDRSDHSTDRSRD